MKVTLKIDDMHCSNCVMILEGIEDRLAGIRSAQASYHKGQLVVEYDENTLRLEKIVEEVTRLGYKVSHAQLHPA